MEKKERNFAPRFSMIDMIRGCACIVIVLYHYYGVAGTTFIFEKSPLMKSMIVNGNYAVDLFFMLSGFCLCANYRDRLVERQISYKKFLIRHYLKFVSYMALTMPLALIKQWLMFKNGWDVKPTLDGILFDLFCIRTGYGITQTFPYNSALWFICVLGLMYLFYTCVCAIASGSKTVYFMACSVMLLFGWALLSKQVSFFVFQEITGRGCCNFFLGTILYEIYEFYRERKKAAVNMLGVTLIGIVIFVISGKYDLCGDSRIAADLFLFVPLVLMASFMPRIENKILDLLIKLAGLATSVYIWHHPIIYLFSGLAAMHVLPEGMNHLSMFVTVLAVVTVVAVISKCFLEKAVYQKLLALTFSH